jgi:hypothetical protein
MVNNMRCYLCGTSDNLTRDHIPPAAFFPKPRPKNLITIPCCLTCNNAWSDGDDIVRLYLTGPLGRSPAGDSIWESRVVTNTLRRRPALVDELLRKMKDVVIETEAGVQEAVELPVDQQLMHRFMVRITKGLLTAHYPNYDYRNAEFAVRTVEAKRQSLELLTPILPMLSHGFRGDRVFQYRHAITDSGMSGLWLYVFYGATLYLVHHTLASAPQPHEIREEPIR